MLWHGFPDTPHSWAGIADAVAAAGYRAVAPWLRGYHPDTNVPGRRFDTATIGEDAIRLLDALGEERAVLVGHDWGASIVFSAAAQAPERVRAIVPIAVPHASLIKPSPRLAWAVRHFLALRTPWAERTLSRNDFAYVDRLYSRWAPNWHGPARDESIRLVKQCFAEPTAQTGAVNYYRALSPRVDPAIRKAPATPGLVVGGKADLFDPSLVTRSAELLREPRRSLLVDNAGHWPHREGEPAFTAGLIDYLEALPG